MDFALASMCQSDFRGIVVGVQSLRERCGGICFLPVRARNLREIYLTRCKRPETPESYLIAGVTGPHIAGTLTDRRVRRRGGP